MLPSLQFVVDRPSTRTGSEPEGLDDEEVALAFDARGEDDELVTDDLATLRLGMASESDDFLNDDA